MKEKVDIRWRDEMAFDASLHENTHKIVLDAMPAVGGRDLGPRPKALILVALGGCTAMDVVSMLKKMRVNFDYFNRIMEDYGFKLVDRDEAQNLGLPEATGLFGELFMAMMEEIKRNKYKENDLGNAYKMTEFEKKISFLNRYFVYKKIRHVNEEKIEIELGEYQETAALNNLSS